MKKDKFNRAILSVDDAIESLFRGEPLNNWLVDDLDEVAKYKEFSYYFQPNYDSIEGQISFPKKEKISVEEFHKTRQAEWLFEKEYFKIDIEEFLLEKCKTDVEKRRVKYELDLYKKKDMTFLLYLMIYIVETMRNNNLVWGVGRGSSATSYCLYLIGIHKVDSIKYDLDINDFLK